MSLTLFYHPLSSYCHKAPIGLYESGLEFSRHLIDLGIEADRALLRSHWALCKFPVLFDSASQKNIPESTSIIEYLNTWSSAGANLIPASPDSAFEVRHWDRLFDNYVHTPMQQIVADRIAQAQADLSPQRQLLQNSYRLIDNQVRSHPWAAGESFSLADCAAAPSLFYASTLEPFPIALKGLNEYFERLVARPSVARVLEEAKPYFQYYPFSEAIPARFRKEANAV